jgi:hypothetical protein
MHHWDRIVNSRPDLKKKEYTEPFLKHWPATTGSPPSKKTVTILMEFEDYFKLNF